MSLIEFVAESIAMRWVLFDYKNTYWLRFAIATAFTNEEQFHAVPAITMQDDVCPRTWLAMVRRVRTDPAALADMLKHPVRAELLHCIFCQTVEVATIIAVVSSSLTADSLNLSLSAILLWGLRILLSGFIGLLTYPIVDSMVMAVENGVRFDLTDRVLFAFEDEVNNNEN